MAANPANDSAIHRVLVTGAGYIGSHLVELLIRQGHQVTVLEQPGVSTSHLPVAARVVRGDVRRSEDVRQAMQHCDHVVHLAANANVWSPRTRDFELVNHQGALRVFEAARWARVQRLVHVSSEAILACAATPTDMGPAGLTGRPRMQQMIGPYCRSKFQAEQAAHSAAMTGLPVVVVSPTVPVGPGDRGRGALTRMLEQVIQGRTGRFYPQGSINLIDVRDVAEGIARALTVGRCGRRYVLAGENWTLQELFTVLADLLNRPQPRWPVPYSLALGMAVLEQAACFCHLKQQPLATLAGLRLSYRPPRCYTHDGSLRELDLALRPVMASLEETLRWLGAPLAAPLAA